MAVRLGDLLTGSGAGIRVGLITATPGDGTVTVSVDGSEITIPHAKNYTPAINDAAIILAENTRRVAIGAFTNPAVPVTPATPAPPPIEKPKPTPPPPTTITGTKTFSATATACFRSGKWRTDTKQPHQGDWNGAFGRNIGAWFYGTQIKNALTGATVTSAQIYMKRISGGVYGSVSPTVYGMPHFNRPGGAPTLQGGGVGLTGMAVNTSRWVALPLSIAQDLVDGVSGGVACWVDSDSPYAVYAALSDSRSSGAVKISYKKVV